MIKEYAKKIFGMGADFYKRHNITNLLLFLLAIGAFISVVLTYAFFTRIFPANASENYMVILLNTDLILLVGVSILLVKKILSLWIERRKNGFGNRLHLKMIIIFVLVSAVPTMLVATFSATFFTMSMQSWFSSQVETAVKDSMNVAEFYSREKREEIIRDIISVSSDFVKNRDILEKKRNLINSLLAIKVAEHDLDEAVVFNNKGKVEAKGGYTFSLTFEEIPFWALSEAERGDIVVLTDGSLNRMRALLKLKTKSDLYLLVGKFVSPEIMKHIRRAKLAVERYNSLSKRRINIEITFYSIFIAVALLLILTSTLAGITFSFNMTKPLNALIDAAEQIRMGKVGIKVREQEGNDEISILNRTFNRMSQEIATQQNDLLNANKETNARRRFIEAVLKGVSAGVISVDMNNNIRLANQPACALLGIDLNEHKGERLSLVVPEFSEVYDNSKVSANVDKRYYVKMHNQTMYKNLTVNIVAEYSKNNEIYGYIYTFDDITPLETAQRKAAWSDVARRIAHEIKNPLTPIVLSAERLKRNYLPQLTEKIDVFENCIGTIISQVENIGKMVDEFSAFARMPLPVMKSVNIKNVIRQCVLLQKNANPDIKYDTVMPEVPVNINCDEGQISHLLTNLLKNSAEAIIEKKPDDGGKIIITLTNTREKTIIVVQDNGIGLKNQSMSQIAEPYFTTKEKGTGLGLAIVKKIVEDHNGTLDIKSCDGLTFASVVLPHEDGDNA